MTPARQLLLWLRFQLVCDFVSGALLLTLPLAVLARFPLPFLPVDAGVLAVRLLGLYPAALAVAFYAATAGGVNARAAWVANAIRTVGGFALLAGATMEPSAPAGLRGMFLGEWLFVAITAVMMARAGLSWSKPGS